MKDNIFIYAALRVFSHFFSHFEVKSGFFIIKKFHSNWPPLIILFALSQYFFRNFRSHFQKFAKIVLKVGWNKMVLFKRFSIHGGVFKRWKTWVHVCDVMWVRPRAWVRSRRPRRAKASARSESPSMHPPSPAPHLYVIRCSLAARTTFKWAQKFTCFKYFVHYSQQKLISLISITFVSDWEGIFTIQKLGDENL